MFTLLHGLWDYMFKRTQYQVLLVGLDNAGKSTFLEQIKRLYSEAPVTPLEKIPPTVGLNIGQLQFENSNILVWDLGGQRVLRSIWEKYSGSAHAIIYMLDASDRDRFLEAREAFGALLGRADTQGAAVLVLANKYDLADVALPDEIQETLQLIELHETCVCRLQPVSALTGEGLELAMKWLHDTLARGERDVSTEYW
eukprot:TRINITY_DN15922_c0_g1_i1.p1 TRINITY_DN15922_c0_g1~~TRINITY_DN15922_c0_g1_i1.p1  ORF type:complete len:198 (-),score=31.84 TRINITY_DN15922_c0_g1_i1:34-627(-)